MCEVVYAELAAAFRGDGARLDTFLADAGVRLLTSQAASLVDAGRRWREHRQSGGSRSRILPDFLIGARTLLRCNAFESATSWSEFCVMCASASRTGDVS